MTEWRWCRKPPSVSLWHAFDKWGLSACRGVRFGGVLGTYPPDVVAAPPAESWWTRLLGKSKICKGCRANAQA